MSASALASALASDPDTDADTITSSSSSSPSSSSVSDSSSSSGSSSNAGNDTIVDGADLPASSEAPSSHHLSSRSHARPHRQPLLSTSRNGQDLPDLNDSATSFSSASSSASVASQTSRSSHASTAASEDGISRVSVPSPPIPLQSRLREFLPELMRANEELALTGDYNGSEGKRSRGGFEIVEHGDGRDSGIEEIASRSVRKTGSRGIEENEDEECEEAEEGPYVELDLGLGVLEELEQEPTIEEEGLRVIERIARERNRKRRRDGDGELENEDVAGLDGLMDVGRSKRRAVEVREVA